MKRVLLITAHFPPDSSAASHRVRLLAPYLADCGWEPVVLTVDADAYEGRLDPDLLSLVPAGLRILRAPAWPAARTRRVGVGDLGIRSFTGLRRAAADAMSHGRFDAVFVTIYPTWTALLGPYLKRRFSVPFVLDYQDPWVGSWGLTVGGGRNGSVDWKSRVTRRLGTWTEPRVVRAADALTAVSERTYADVLARVRPIQAPVCETIPLGWDAADRAAIARIGNPCFDPSDGNVHLVYVGTVLPMGIDVVRALLTALGALRDTTPTLYARIRLHFVGSSNQSAGDPSPRVMPLARETGVETAVSEHPRRVGYLQALRLMADANGILLLGSSEPHYTASKIFPALLAQRPLLACFHESSNAATLLRDFGRPPSVYLQTFNGIAPPPDALFRSLTAVAARTAYDDAAVDWRAAAPFSGRALAGRLAAVLDKIASRARGRELGADASLLIGQGRA